MKTKMADQYGKIEWPLYFSASKCPVQAVVGDFQWYQTYFEIYIKHKAHMEWKNPWHMCICLPEAWKFFHPRPFKAPYGSKCKVKLWVTTCSMPKDHHDHSILVLECSGGYIVTLSQRPSSFSFEMRCYGAFQWWEQNFEILVKRWPKCLPKMAKLNGPHSNWNALLQSFSVLWTKFWNLCQTLTKMAAQNGEIEWHPQFLVLKCPVAVLFSAANHRLSTI